MTAIRTFVFALFSVLTIGAGQAHAAENSLSGFIENLTGTWTCRAEQSDALTETVFTDTFHSAISEASHTSVEERHPGSVQLVAERVWDAIWADEQVLYELVSETAFRLILESKTEAENTSLTCSQQALSTDI